jgi:hypothetical protein
MSSSKWCRRFHSRESRHGDRQSRNGHGRAVIASACVDLQVYRVDVLLRVKKSLQIRQLRMSLAQYSMNLSG